MKEMGECLEVSGCRMGMVSLEGAWGRVSLDEWENGPMVEVKGWKDRGMKWGQADPRLVGQSLSTGVRRKEGEASH
jgi:hypothetical protein